MSINKHRSFRKVLEIQTFTIEYNGQVVSAKRVFWCLADSVTSRTVKTRHIGVTTYVGSVKFTGISAWSPSKAVSLNLKATLQSKYFDNINLASGINESLNRAYHSFILGDDSRCKNLPGIVQWFNGDTGCIQVMGQVYRVYACNIRGAKTWYSETACVYLNKGDTVTVNLSDMGDHLTCSVIQGGHLDTDKWNSLDHSKLAFRCDDNGKALNGLFE